MPFGEKRGRSRVEEEFVVCVCGLCWCAEIDEEGWREGMSRAAGGCDSDELAAVVCVAATGRTDEIETIWEIGGCRMVVVWYCYGSRDEPSCISGESERKWYPFCGYNLLIAF